MINKNGINQKSLNLLDCSFRDGGYYNNWLFKKKDLDFYLKCIAKTNIKYIEIGFRFINNKNSGLTAYSNDQFLKKLNIINNIKIGVMINASDFILDNKISYIKLKRVFPHFKYLSFIRIAFHNKDIKNVIKITNYLSNKKIKIMLNLMQISELTNYKILQTLKMINNLNIEAFYIADSFGSLNSTYINKVSKLLKKNCKFKIGFHAHDNLSLAFKNAKRAIKENFTYIDSTILGMGRGAGNLKTEEIYKFLNDKDKIGNLNIQKIKKKIFDPLKKKFKWGSNPYYKFAGKNSIHPSYVQELLNNKNYNNKEYFKILISLSKIDSTKYNPENLIFQNKGFTNQNNYHFKLNSNVLILGSSLNLIFHKNKIEKFSENLNLSVIAVNLNRIFPDNKIDYRVVSHPQRIQMDYTLYKIFNNKFIIPFNKINPKILNYLKKQRIDTFNYALKTHKSKKLSVFKNCCYLPNYLVLGYALSFAISRNAKKIYLAGFDGFDKDNFNNDESAIILEMFKKTYKNIKIISITPTKFNIKNKKLN